MAKVSRYLNALYFQPNLFLKIIKKSCSILLCVKHTHLYTYKNKQTHHMKFELNLLRLFSFNFDFMMSLLDHKIEPSSSHAWKAWFKNLPFFSRTKKMSLYYTYTYVCTQNCNYTPFSVPKTKKKIKKNKNLSTNLNSYINCFVHHVNCNMMLPLNYK